jgi:oligopeptide/dipeptide ABC transporter ATP-binding protein
MSDWLLEAHDLRRTYRSHDRPDERITAVDGVSLKIERGEWHGLVGESGSGKSTLARLLLALERPDHGTVLLDGQPISRLPEARVRPLRRRFQAVFQDPIASLNPRLRVATIVAEPLVAHGIGSSADRRRRVGELLALVGLSPDAARRFPGAFSGGERQRIAIARALAPDPELLVLDEPLSNLDVTVQAQILELLGDLHRRFGLTALLVSHDLAVVREVSNRVTVMFRGVFVEQGATGEVLGRPGHPYTRALLAAAPHIGTHEPPPASEAPSHDWPPGACRYAPHCPSATDRCSAEPTLEPVADGHLIACWFPFRGDGQTA